ncbi:protein PRR14L-like [Ctenocephalides felis]|uniref:protein PRR14L-like n=1 Tax=Ctenocephalides felis TaxID=7515 RepID=UPI000E6E1028|nr:protein PRR14L-like [Ctenocephalides felis]XP_026474330.1 protein PRR14L-like [Ctenocephalides felis]XP_026474331.1 protein PRR14L-like [Ctenocephalides felis]
MAEEVDSNKCQSPEEPLHSYMQSLQLSSQDGKDEESKESSKMVLRKKVRPLNGLKRRVKTEPKKIKIDLSDEERLKIFYTSANKNFKKPHSTCLETIFEEPHSNADKIIYIGGRKIRRSLNLESSSVLNGKIKKRKAKIKKFFGKLNRFKGVSQEQLLLNLSSLDGKEE